MKIFLYVTVQEVEIRARAPGTVTEYARTMPIEFISTETSGTGDLYNLNKELTD